jgi:cellulose synthase/poly-beta-1,6-N-acetylglucosamine synthase-like glycosyltransferase
MAFDYQLFKSLMANEDIENNPGEDREINLELLRQGLVCEYIEDAYIYDEKVQSNAVLERQRIRWLSAQLQYAKRCWLEEPLKTLSHGIHYADFALQTLFLPRSLLLMTILAMAVLNMLLKLIPGMGIIYPAGSWWGCLFGGCLLSLIISMEALPLLDLKKGLISFPHAFWAFFRALTKSNSKQREFIHTPKQYIHAEDS